MSIEVKNLYFSYDLKFNKNMRYVLSDINFNYKENQILALIGKTGSGKSTLVQTLNGLEKPFSGKIDVDDYKLDYSLKYKKNNTISFFKMKKLHKKKIKNVLDLRKKVGVVFQFPEYQLFENTVFDDVSYGVKKFYPKEDYKAKVIEALNLVGLDSSYYERSPLELSGGEKRRVALAGILAFNPKYLILDEPTVGLDYDSKIKLLDILKKLSSNNTGIILVTHDMELLLSFVNRVIVLNEGKIIIDTSPLSLFKDEKFMSTSDFQLPECLKCAFYLKERGFDIDLDKIKDDNSLIEEIKRIKKYE